VGDMLLPKACTALAMPAVSCNNVSWSSYP
jgi:hypothetical protein